MDSKLLGAISLYLHPSTDPGTREAAHNRAAFLAHKIGKTLDEAIATYQADPLSEAIAAKAAAQSWEEMFPDNPAAAEMMRKTEREMNEKLDREARMWAEKDHELQAQKARADTWRDKVRGACGRTKRSLGGRGAVDRQRRTLARAG